MPTRTAHDDQNAMGAGRKLRVITSCLLVGVVSTLAAGPVQAQAVSYSFSPSSGPAGTTISFEGSGCLPDDNPDRIGRTLRGVRASRGRRDRRLTPHRRHFQ